MKIYDEITRCRWHLHHGNLTFLEVSSRLPLRDFERHGIFDRLDRD